MKKYIFTLLLTMGGGAIIAQSYADYTDIALRYSQNELDGTARYKAMSGAFGALGGDLSAISENPAGSSVFNTANFAFTLGNSHINNNSTFFGNSTETKNSNFTLNQLGAVFVFRNYSPDSNWKKFSLAFNYNKTNNFDGKNLIFSGINPEKSVINFFGVNAEGFNVNEFIIQTNKGETLSSVYRDMGNNGGNNAYALQQGLLGYQGYLIDTKPSSNDSYESRATIPSKGIRQAYTLEQYGGTRKYSFNFSGQYSDNIYLGLNLNSHTVNYRKRTAILEDGYSADSGVQKVDFVNDLQTNGGGFSLQLGAIVKATDNLRLGVSYQSPTWYTLQDETNQYLRTNVRETATSTTVSSINVSPDVQNIYEKYDLRTPSQWTGSVAYLFGKKGLLSLDYIYRGYGKAKFDTEVNTDFVYVNQDIQNLFADTNSIRLGGEFRVTPQFSVRGGYRFEQSPYKDKKLMGNLNGYSFGLGYNFGGLTLDLAYDFAHRDFQYQMYDVGLTNRANVKSDNHNLLLTLSMKL